MPELHGSPARPAVALLAAGWAGEYNWGGAFGTYFWIDPKEQMAVVFMSAAPGEGRARFRNIVKNMVVQAIDD